MKNMIRFLCCILFVSLVPMLNIVQAQESVTINGSVTDSEGQTLPGVNIVIKGTTKGTITDTDGNYIIKASIGDVLQFSYIGYLNAEVKIENQTTITVTMEPDFTVLDEIVVIGYGTAKKKDLTGAVSVVSAEDFNKGNITSAQELLLGKTAGVLIATNNGAPGGGSTIRIRGGSSLNASNDPLVIIDGVPLGRHNVGGSANLLSAINPNDIENVTILKDASSTAIYGARASNGVIIITTKKGQAGKPLVLSYNGSTSISTLTKFVDVYTGDEYRELAPTIPDSDPGLLDLLGNANTDWQDEIFRTGISHTHNIGGSGAYKILPYRVSLGYTDQTGILENTDMQRITGAVSLNPKFFKESLKVNVNAKIMSTKNNFGDAGAIGSAVSMDPTQPIMDGTEETGGYFQWPTYGANLGTSNPVEQALEVDNKSDVLKFIGNVNIQYDIPYINGLNANFNLATDYSDGKGQNNRPVTSPSTLTAPLNGRLQDYEHTFNNNLLELYFNYKKQIATIHNIDVTAGYSWEHHEREGKNYTRGIVDEFNAYQMTDSTYYITEKYLASFFGRMNYILMDKYLLTGTIRYDGSSLFNKEDRWGLFPSAALAWKIHEEEFLTDVSIISQLKFRVGWGLTGQQEIMDTDYPAQAIYVEASEGSYYRFGGRFLPTLRPKPYDPHIKWEETTTQNIALDFGLYDGRISGTIDVYKRITDDLINEVTVPSGSNFSNRLTTNVGSLENLGYEINLNAIPLSKQDISLELGFNISHNKTEITKLLITDDPDYIGVLYGDAFTGYNQVSRVGSAPYSFFVNKQVYDNEGNPIEGLYEDLSGEGGTVSGDDLDKYVFHDPFPDYTMGLSFRFNYKQFDLSGSSRANIGNYVQNRVASGSSFDQMQQIGYWKNMPKYLDDSKFIARQFTSDYYIHNASFLKLDNITAAYTFVNLVSNLNLGISFTVQNVLTITKYEGIDPEVFVDPGLNAGDPGDDVVGIDNNLYPRPRIYTIGLSLNF
ncbi:SusC/RagA family TonB-linked outer membrane protein [Bacteroidota bacterium]